MVAGVVGSGDYRLALNPVPSQAFATPQVVNGFVVGATLTSGGSGYVTSPAVSIFGKGGTNATAVSHISGGVVTNISITSAGIGYTNAVTVQIAPPPAAAVFPTVQPVMRVDCTNLAPYDNYQVQFQPAVGGAWGNWAGGLFSPTGVTNSQYLFITNGVGFFRPHTRLALASHSDSLEFPKGRRGHCLWWTPPQCVDDALCDRYEYHVFAPAGCPHHPSGRESWLGGLGPGRHDSRHQCGC